MKDTPSKRQFDLPSVLSVASGLNLCRKTGGVFAVVQYMTNSAVDATSLPDAMEAARQEIFKQNPALKTVCATLPRTGEVKGWVNKQKAIFGDHVLLGPKQ